MQTRMHSSMMRTVRSSSRLLGGVGLSACWDTAPRCVPGKPPPRCGPGDTPRCGPGDTPGCGPGDTPLPYYGPGDPPQARPLNFPPGCGPGDLQCMLGYHPPPRQQSS